MPFTLSHAAAVLPFSGLIMRRHVFSAVVIGSMVPDFGMFSPWRMDRVETHSALALLTFSLPIGLASYWIFQYVMKVPIIEVLPSAAYARWRTHIAPARIDSAAQWLLVMLGLMGGALTHLVWDGFTHEGARGVRLIPALDDPIVEFGGHHLIGYRLLQNGSSLIGLGFVVVVAAFALRYTHGESTETRLLGPAERRNWVIAYVIVMASIGLAAFLVTRRAALYGHSYSAYLNYAAFASVRGLAGGLLIVSLALSYRLRSVLAVSTLP